MAVAIFAFLAGLAALAQGHFEDLAIGYKRLSLVLPLVITFSVVGIVVMRAVHFIGTETLFHPMIGTYHRPVIQEKVPLRR